VAANPDKAWNYLPQQQPHDQAPVLPGTVVLCVEVGMELVWGSMCLHGCLYPAWVFLR
jgi:hypothetical protein